MRNLILLAAILLFISLSLVAQDTPPPEPSMASIDYFYTHHRADGNRFADGAGTFPDVEMLSIDSHDAALWLDGFAGSYSFGWRYLSLRLPNPIGIGFSISSLRETYSFGLLDAVEIPAEYQSTLALMTPPSGSTSFRFDVPFADISPTSPAVSLDDAGTYAYITTNGDIILWRDDAEVSRYAANAMLDARLTISAAGQIAVYAEPTTRYPHAIMGNDIEAAALLILALENDQLVEIERITLLPDAVFEAITPIWADVDQDGNDDIITTVSDRNGGARVDVYTVEGTILAQTSPIGTGFRWRHVIAAANFGPDGAFELVEVVTPHIGGIVQFLRYNAQTNTLDITARTGGYTSHAIGSPNLDQAIAGDFNGDGTPELVVTTQTRGRLVGLQQINGDISEVWSIALDAAPVSNFAAVTLPDAQLALAIGLADASLRVWLPASSDS